jgi:metallo-beta-lactamase family protein
LFPNSLGYALKHEIRKIFGKEYDVKVSVEVMDLFSAHADYAEMIDYPKCQDTDKATILVHGEIETQTVCNVSVKVGFQNISIPHKGEGFDLGTVNP